MKPTVRATSTHGIYSAFDLAFVLGIAQVGRCPLQSSRFLVRELLALQREDGRWVGAPNLRVTEQECYRPWERPAGHLYTDTNGLITTAIATRMLAAEGFQ